MIYCIIKRIGIPSWSKVAGVRLGAFNAKESHIRCRMFAVQNEAHLKLHAADITVIRLFV